jgi:hypothetical protein
VVKNWRQTIEALPCSALINKLGSKALLFAGAILCGKLVRLVYTRQLYLQREAALLGATLTHAAFSTSICHPSRLLEFADFHPSALWEGAPLFQDPYSLSASCAAEGAEELAAVLVRNACALEALPLLTFWEYLCTVISRCPRQSVRCRILQTNALISLGLLASAHATIRSVLSGTHLPSPRGGTDFAPIPAVNDATGAARFHVGLYPGNAQNQAAIAEIMQGAMTAELGSWLQPWLCAEIALARCRWLHAVGKIPYLWSKTHPTKGRELDSSDTIPEKARLHDTCCGCNSGKCLRHGP